MSAFHLFSCFGIELEYMIVDRNTLNVTPLTDRLIQAVHGQITSEIERGPLCWSNELVAHVVEFKTNGPQSSLEPLAQQFHTGVTEANRALAQFGAQLMPTAMHPWMNPTTDTQLWAHDYNEVYEAYDRIFQCQGHGWSNVQSVHLNLPFANDEQSSQLHSAIRLILPLIPALCASSPYVESKLSGAVDSRLRFYENNQSKVPIICNGVIPEIVNSGQQYESEIFARIFAAIRPYDPDNILQNEWLNSRGAIARFERMAIEIRIMDIQECPRADLACAALIVALLQKLVTSAPPNLPSHELKTILDATVLKGGEAMIENPEYLQIFSVTEKNISAQDLLLHLKNHWLSSATLDHSALDLILHQGTLAQRLMTRLGDKPTAEHLRQTYQELCQCLAENKQFEITG